MNRYFGSSRWSTFKKVLFGGALVGIVAAGAACSNTPASSTPASSTISAGRTDAGAGRIARIRRMDAEIERTGSWQPLLDAMSDDVTLRATIPAGTPISGTFRGKAEVRRYFEKILPSVISRFEQQMQTELVPVGEKMIVIGDDAMILAESGVRHRSPYVTIYEYDSADKIRSMLIVQDLSAIAEHYHAKR